MFWMLFVGHSFFAVCNIAVRWGIVDIVKEAVTLLTRLMGCVTGWTPASQSQGRDIRWDVEEVRSWGGIGTSGGSRTISTP